MQRWSALALVGVLVASAMLLVFRVGHTGAGASPAPSVSASAAPSSSAGPSGSAPPSLDVGAPAAPDLALDDELAPAPALAKSADTPPSVLPEGAPKTVVFGVVLVEYQGAQAASRKARTREAADALAKELVEEARKDFASAVAKGDPGSMENAGVMPRGILEAGPEQLLFTLAPGDVGGPVDTPRGLWIVKRVE